MRKSLEHRALAAYYRDHLAEVPTELFSKHRGLILMHEAIDRRPELEALLQRLRPLASEPTFRRFVKGIAP